MVKRIAKALMILILTAVTFSGAATTGAHALTTNVRVGFCAYMSPYQYLASDGTPKGFHIDLMKEVADDVDLVLEYIPFNTTSEAMEGLKKGDVDMVLGVAQEQFYSNYARYSSPLSTANICMIADERAALNYRAGKNHSVQTAVEFGLVGYTYLNNIGSGNIILTGNQESSMEMLLSGRTDLMVGVKECILWYLEQEGLSDNYIIVNNYVSSADFSIAVQHGDRQLCNNIDESLSELRTSSTYDDLYNKWFNFSSVDYRQLFRIALIAIIVGLSVVAVSLLISFRRRTARA